MRIAFDESKHIYTVNGDFADISVTELLGKHGLAPDFSKVPKETRLTAAAQGKLIHEDIEKFIKSTEPYKPVTLQCEQFAEWVHANVDSATAEQMVAHLVGTYAFVGTADVVGVTKDDELFVGDHKCTAVFEREYVTWQVSLYDYFLRHIGGDGKINGRSWRGYKGASKFFCFHYNVKAGTLKVHELEKIPDSEIERLLNCEVHGVKYKRPSLVVEQQLREQWENAENTLVEMERAYKEQENKVKELRQRLCDEMEKQGIESFESGKLRLKYIRAAESLTTDTKALKAQFPQVYAAVQKIVKRKAYVRMTIKGEDDDDDCF